LLHTINIELEVVQAAVNDVSPVIHDTTRNVRTLVETLPGVSAAIRDIHGILPGIADNVTTIVELTQSIIPVYDEVRKWHDAPEYVRDLEDEIQRFNSYLGGIQRYLRENSITDRFPDEASPIIERAKETVEELKRNLKEVQKSYPKQQNSRLEWPQEKSKCQRLRKQLREHRQELTDHFQFVQECVYFALNPEVC
jgi:lipase chaperone LimK